MRGPTGSWHSTFMARLSFAWLIGPILLIQAARLRYLFLQRRRRKAKLCPRCGYDLRASDEGCPECGYGRIASVGGLAEAAAGSSTPPTS
jgi:hypothetical protein